MGKTPKKGTPQVRKLTPRQEQQAANTNNAVRGFKKVVVRGVTKWVPIKRD